MTGQQNTRRPLVALVCVTIMLLSTFGPSTAGAAVTSGGSATVSDAGNAPGVYVPGTGIDSSTDSYVEVAYNATGQGVQASDLGIMLSDGNGDFIASNTSVTTLEGVANITITAGTLGSDVSVNGDLINTSDSSWLATDTASFTVSGGGGSGIPAAPYVNGSDASIDPSVQSLVTHTYNASGQVGSTDHIEVSVRNDSSGQFIAQNTTLSTFGGTADLVLPVGEGAAPFRATVFLNNSSTGMPLTTDVVNYTTSGGGSIPGAPYVNGTDQSIDPSVPTTVYYTYNATGMVGAASDLNVTVRNQSSGQIIAYNSTLAWDAGSAAVTIPAGEGLRDFTATISLDNETAQTTLTTDVANYSTSGGSGGGSNAINISGYVHDDSGNGIPNANVVVYSPTRKITTTTNASGGYNVSGAAGFYAFEFNATGYGSATAFTELEDGQNDTINVTLTPPGFIDGQVTDESGNPVAGVTVSAWGLSSATDTTDAQGRYNLSVSAGTYFVEIQSQSYPSQSFRGVSVTTGETTTQNATISDPGYITGRIVNQTGNPVSMAWVMVDSGDQMAYGQTNQTGHLNLSVVPGTYRLSAFGTQGGMASYNGDIDVIVGDTVDIGTIQMVNPQVLASEVSHVGGTAPNMNQVSVNAFSMGGMMGIMVENSSTPTGGMPKNLSTVGVDNTTVFEITLTVTDFDPNALLWGARDVTWTARENKSHPAATDITVRTKAVHLAGIDGQVGGKNLPVGPMAMSGMSPDDFKWPTGAKDRADLDWENTVYFLLYDLSNVPPSVSQNLDNMTVVTNAQTFSRPRMVNDTLKVYVAGPHYTKRGDLHDGFYSAFIPEAQLDAWDVSDPANELAAKYQGSSKNFNVEVTNTGAWIHLDIHYSDGYAEISPSSDSGSSDDSSTNTVIYADSSDDTTSDDSTSDETTVSIGAATTNADGTQTASASVSNARANSTISLTFHDGDAADDDGSSGNSTSDDADSALEELDVSLSDDADFEVNVSTTNDPPAEATASGEPAGSDVVSYVQIDHDGLLDDQISAASLTIRVKKVRFDDDFDETNAVVYRLHDGEWTELETTLIGETSTQYRFRAESPGLSVFAVGQKEPDISIAGLELATDSAEVGEDISVVVTLLNEGSGSGTYTADLAVDGTDVESRTVTVPAGDSVTTTFAWEFGAGGDYVLSVNGDEAGTVSVDTVERVTTTTPDPTTTTTPDPTTTTSDDSSESMSTTTGAETPGFGLVLGLLALIGGAVLARD